METVRTYALERLEARAENFATAWKEGEELSPEDAVRLALASIAK
jgi:hypothetical protein